jgi:hypothetical protein
MDGAFGFIDLGLSQNCLAAYKIERRKVSALAIGYTFASMGKRYFGC